MDVGRGCREGRRSLTPGTNIKWKSVNEHRMSAKDAKSEFLGQEHYRLQGKASLSGGSRTLSPEEGSQGALVAWASCP